MNKKRQYMHNRNAPFWAAAFIIFGLSGIATTWVDLGNFWSGYMLDIMGPAWNYILFRGLFTYYAENKWTRFFTPVRTYVIFVFISFSIEGLQYLNVYNATFDPWDLVSYVSLLTPLFIIDIFQYKSK